MNIRSQIKGALYGVAVGDALGAPLEFMAADEIQRKHGTVRDMIGGGWLNVEPGEITDDTQMTLAVAEGIVENPSAPIVSIGRRFIEWLDTTPKDIGATCHTAISCAISFAENKKAPTALDWRDASLRTHQMSGGQSAGNGSLMRTVYPGLFYTNRLEALDHASDISEMTHHDMKATLACRLYTGMIVNVLGIPRVKHRLNVIRELCMTSPLYSNALSKNFTTMPTGYVVDSFACALHCILTTDSFEEAIVKAVNLGGDADTIGAITGGLAGAVYGFNGIPARWVKCLNKSICARLENLVQAAIDNRANK